MSLDGCRRCVNRGSKSVGGYARSDFWDCISDSMSKELTCQKQKKAGGLHTRPLVDRSSLL